jgi:hypothetical protein
MLTLGPTLDEYARLVTDVFRATSTHLVDVALPHLFLPLVCLQAFDDPEFRKLFSEYMDDLQDPKHREETEAYISQLEGDKKVPEGKEIIR